MPGYRIPKDEIPKFSGSSTEDPNQWKDEILFNAKLMPKRESKEVKNMLRVRLMKLGLEGAAKSWYDNLSKEIKKDFLLSMAAFKAKFVNKEQVAVNFANFNRRIQEENEDVETYAYDLLRLIRMSIPDMTEVQRVLKFVDGLQPKLRKALSRMKLKTMDEAVSAAKREEVLNGKEKVESKKRKSEEVVEEKLENFFDKISHMVDNKIRKINSNSSPHFSRSQNSNYRGNYDFNFDRRNKFNDRRRNYNSNRSYSSNYSRNTRNERGEPICFNCGKAGHMQFRCPVGEIKNGNFSGRRNPSKVDSSKPLPHQRKD